MCATPVFPPSLSAAPSPDDQAAPVAADLCVAASAEPLSEASSFPALTLRWRGVEPYETSFDAMRAFTDERDSETADEIWLVEHPPVFTLGQAGNPAHLLAADSGIPLVKVDRGGQITYHGPGQVVAYLLLDLRRHKLMVRELVTRIEQAVIDTLRIANVYDLATPGEVARAVLVKQCREVERVAAGVLTKLLGERGRRVRSDRPDEGGGCSGIQTVEGHERRAAVEDAPPTLVPASERTKSGDDEQPVASGALQESSECIR